MKRLLAVLLSLSLLLALCPAGAEEPDILTQLMDDIEVFDPDQDGALALPMTTDELMEQLMEDCSKASTTLDVTRLASYGITFEQLMTTEYYTYLPVAATTLAICNYRDFQPEDHMLTVRGYKYTNPNNAADRRLITIIFDYQVSPAVIYMGYWTPGDTTMLAGSINMTVNEFINGQYGPLYQNAVYCPASKLNTYYGEFRQEESQPLQVGKVSFTISPDRQHIFLTRPVITGGSGSVTIAYNIYDSNSNPVNYFYSTEEHVAATPGYGGLFNVFVVVVDEKTGESNTQNIGWQEMAWPPAAQLTVGPLSYEISEDGNSVYLNRPTIACKSGSVTIAYVIYDAQSKPVNYFYSTFPRVAATPGYAGKFNVFVTVKDTVTGESITQNIGWVLLGYGSQQMYRALIVGNSEFARNNNLSCCKYDAQHMTELLQAVNGGKYQGHITTLENTTTATLQSGISSTFAGAKAGDVSLFYISSHGLNSATTGDYAGAVVMSDESLVKWKDLASWLNTANPANKVIVLVDACGSGAPIDDGTQTQPGAGKAFNEKAFNRSVLSAFAAIDRGITVPVITKDENGQSKTGELRTSKFEVITASRNGEISIGYTTGSLFTNMLVAGVGTTGDMPADTNKDGYITTNELYTFVYAKVVNAGASSTQYPQVWPTASSYQLFWR